MRHAVVRTCVGLAVLAVVVGMVRQREALAGGTMYWTDVGIHKIQRVNLDGILAPPTASLNILGFILEAAAQRAIPTMFATGAFMLEQGGLATYGPDSYDSGQQAARLVDKILKGANPAEIPVEVNAKIEFIINLKAAKALGLTIAPEVLYQATQLIR